ncbi:hypothetical protein [Streptomyces sp. NPDC094149]|uniref:hypothetical protein n=1 Tax=Streptomyces sp. NPDC094149 TaxID=3155079 RepID=UPI003318A5FC
MAALLWDDVKWFFDPVEMGTLPDVFVPDTSIEDWQAVLDLVGEQGWAFEYSEGGTVLPLLPLTRTGQHAFQVCWRPARGRAGAFTCGHVRPGARNELRAGPA